MPIGCKLLKLLDRVVSIMGYLRIRSHRLASSIDAGLQDDDAIPMARSTRLAWPRLGLDAPLGLGTGAWAGPGGGDGSGRTDAMPGMERDCDADHYTRTQPLPPGWYGRKEPVFRAHGLPPEMLGGNDDLPMLDTAGVWWLPPYDLDEKIDIPPGGLAEKIKNDGDGPWRDVVVVPRDPTPAMVEAGRKAFAQGDPIHVSHARVLWIWRDMIEAMEAEGR